MPFNLLGEMDCITDINSPIKSVVGLLNSPGASCGAATSTPKREIHENGHTEDSKDEEKKTKKRISSVGDGEMSSRSDLIYVSDDVKKVDEVLDKLISNDQNDNSVIEKVYYKGNFSLRSFVIDLMYLFYHIFLIYNYIFSYSLFGIIFFLFQ